MIDKKIEVKLVDSYKGLEALEEQWQSLLDRYQQRTFFSTWEWIDTIVKHYGSLLKPSIITVFDDGELIGIAPLAIVKEWGILRVVRFLGMGPFNYSIADYLDFIIADGKEETVVRAVLDELKRRSHTWDIIDLHEITETSPLAPLISEVANQNGLHIIKDMSGACYPLSLPDTWEQYLSMLSSKERANIKRKTKKINRDCSVRFEIIEDEAQLAPAMDTLINLHTARWRSEASPGLFALDGVGKFHTDLALKLLKKGWTYLFVMYADDRPVGASYNFRYDGAVYYYTYGYDPAHIWSNYSLGTILNGYDIKTAIEDGIRKFDFLRGHGAYKTKYGASRVGQFRLHLFKSRSLLYAYLGLKRLRTTLSKASTYRQNLRIYNFISSIRNGRNYASTDDQ